MLTSTIEGALEPVVAEVRPSLWALWKGERHPTLGSGCVVDRIGTLEATLAAAGIGECDGSGGEPCPCCEAPGPCRAIEEARQQGMARADSTQAKE